MREPQFLGRRRSPGSSTGQGAYHRIFALTRVGGPGRLLTGTKARNPRYYRFLRAFRERSGVPVVLKISFYEDGLSCWMRPSPASLRTRMNMLVLGEWFIERMAAAR